MTDSSRGCERRCLSRPPSDASVRVAGSSRQGRRSRGLALPAAGAELVAAHERFGRNRPQLIRTCRMGGQLRRLTGF